MRYSFSAVLAVGALTFSSIADADINFSLVGESPSGEIVALVDGRHKVTDLSPGYIDVTKTDDGHILEILTLTHSDRLVVSADWESENDDMWYRVSVDRVKVNGEVQTESMHDKFDSTTRVRFDPWGSQTRDALLLPPHDVVYQRFSDRRNTLTLNPCWECAIPDDEGNRILFEYSVVQFPAPLSADFDYDGDVDFQDFLWLSYNFERPHPISVGAFHYLGDANLDSTTDFEDFLILRNSFGATREPAAAPVPESATAALLTFIAFVCTGLARKRRSG